MTFSVPSSRLMLTALAALFSLVGCRQASIESYRIPHETAKAASARTDAMALSTVPSAAGAPEVHWALPPGWVEQPDQTGMRKGSFVVTDQNGHEATIAVTVFPGDVGGDLANVNRWREQLQLPPITVAELGEVIAQATLPAGVFKRVDIVGGEPAADPAHDHRTRILGSWLKQETRTWFFKMTGDATLVQNQMAAFDTFLSSVHFVDEPVVSAAAGALSWSAPAGWKSKDLGPMRKASYDVGVGGGFSVIAFPGDAGGDLANINRWRNQIELPPLAAAQLATETTAVTANDLKFAVVDFVASDQRLIGAILPFAGQTYFFKLTGPAAVVDAAKSDFIAFLHSVTAR